MQVNDILAEREKTHGSFSDHAFITQRLKSVLLSHEENLSDTQSEALEMICHKIGRILAGNPNFKDHWDDIAGYATLCSKELDNETNK